MAPTPRSNDSPRRSWLRRPVLAFTLAVLALGVLSAGWWWLRAVPAQTPGGVSLGSLPRGVSRTALNLVVVTLDTTRADRIGAYGARDVQTPAVDALAREGVLFEQAVSVAPLTLPAHSSIFTGRFPPEHGVRDNGGFFLGPDQVTLAEVLKARGYRTGGFVAAYVLDSKWGSRRGSTPTSTISISAGRRWCRSGRSSAPATRSWTRRSRGSRRRRTPPSSPGFTSTIPTPRTDPPEPFRSEYKGHPYNGEIAFADSQVARVVSRLKELGLYDRTVIAVIGDHGESLGDHGEATHAFFIYNSTIHVPFVVRTPFGLTEGRRVADPVREVDLMPTVLDLLGVPSPKTISGVSLVPLMTGAKRELGLDAYSESLYPLHHYGWSDLHSLRAGRYKLIDAPRPELYDVDRDPGEGRNLFDERRSIGDAMLAQLRRMESGFEKTEAALPAEDVDPEARARLAALGYVGSFVATASDPRTGRADPKDKIGVVNTLGRVMDLARDRKDGDEETFARVISMLNGVVADDPTIIDGWFMLGSQYMRHGEPAKAVEYFKKTLSLKPDYDVAVVNLAGAYRQMGDDEAALAGYEHYLEIDPKDAYVRYQIGEIWLDRGDLDKAERVFDEALALDPNVAAARNALGVIALERGDAGKAERLIRAALEAKPNVRLAHYNLALLAEKRGDLRAAEREYLEELKQHPETFKAAFNLSRLYHEVGDREGEIDALKQSIVSNPFFPEGHLYLARLYLEAGEFDEAVRLARKGIELAPKAEYAALGHYVLADVLNRQGRPREAAVELAAGRALEARGQKQPRSGGDRP